MAAFTCNVCGQGFEGRGCNCDALPDEDMREALKKAWEDDGHPDGVEEMSDECPGCGRRDSDPVGAGCNECAEEMP